MLHIGICDDDREAREKIYDMVMHAVFSYDEIDFEFFESGRRVIDRIEENKFQCDLLFLDINMPECDGFEVAKYIRENNVDVDIIFVTVSAEHVFEGYVYRAFSYILKPVDSKRLEDEIARYMNERFSGSNCLHVTINNKKEHILLDKVLYFEGDGRKIRIHQKGEEMSFYAKMSDLELMLETYGFVRCHQSYIVNKKYIKGCSRTEIKLDSETLPVSRKYQEKVREII